MKLKIKEIAIFAVLGALFFASKIFMEMLPNIHILGTLVIAYTIKYRLKALFPIYIGIFLNGLFSGFAMWWIPYLYIWIVLWGISMLLPKNMPTKFAIPVYMIVCAMHGFLFGVLYAPAQALLFGLNFEGMISWIIAGLPFDLIHGVSNFCCGALIIPIVKALTIAEKSIN